MCIICGTSYGMFWSLCPALVVRPSLGELLSAFCLSIRVFDSTNACTSTGSAVGALWFDALGRQLRAYLARTRGRRLRLQRRCTTCGEALFCECSHRQTLARANAWTNFMCTRAARLELYLLTRINVPTFAFCMHMVDVDILQTNKGSVRICTFVFYR